MPYEAIIAAPVREDATRRRIVKVIFTIYWLLILEGVIRKWGLPQMQQAIFFLRIPFTLLVYAMALHSGKWPRTCAPLLALYICAVAAIFLVPLQLIAGSYDNRYIILTTYGWINYFFLAPLPFLIADQFRIDDLSRLTRHAAWVAIASVPVVALQFISPANSIFNQGTSLEEANQIVSLGAALGYIRPSGFFSSVLGQSMFVASVAALLLGAFVHGGKSTTVNSGLLWIGVLAVLTLIALSQSRTLFFLIGLIVFAATVGGIIANRQRVVIRTAVWLLAVGGVGVILWPLLFPTSFEVFSARWTGANESERNVFKFGVFGRAFYGFFSFIYYLPETPFFGYFLGLGGNAASRLDWVQLPKAALEWQGYGGWAEGSWDRHIVELGPVLGISYIGIRVALTAWVALKVIRATKQSHNPMPIILFGFSGPVLLTATITGQGNVNGFVWFFLGLTLAACKAVVRGNRVFTQAADAPMRRALLRHKKMLKRTLT